MINFNSLPADKPASLPENGTYYATIDSAEMKKGKDTTKPAYLNISLLLKNKEGKSCGKIFDIISESDKELVQYKLARFIKALGLEQLGVFELADLVKIVKNKQLIVDVKQEEAQNGYPAKAVVDVFAGEIYYPISEAKEIFGTTVTATDTKPVTNVAVIDDDLSIDESDAADVHPADDDEF